LSLPFYSVQKINRTKQLKQEFFVNYLFSFLYGFYFLCFFCFGLFNFGWLNFRFA